MTDNNDNPQRVWQGPHIRNIWPAGTMLRKKAKKGSCSFW